MNPMAFLELFLYRHVYPMPTCPAEPANHLTWFIPAIQLWQSYTKACHKADVFAVSKEELRDKMASFYPGCSLSENGAGKVFTNVRYFESPITDADIVQIWKYMP